MKYTILFLLPCLLLSFPPLLTAQQSAEDFLLEASRTADPDRYFEVRGTPYRYKNFTPGVLIDMTLNEYEIDSLNFNGFSSQFEYFVDGELRELAGSNFLRATIKDDDGQEHIYGWNINPKFRNKYAELLYRGDYVTGMMTYEVLNDEKEVQDVGKTLKLRRFSAKSHYYAMVDGELVALKLTPKSLAEELGYKNELLKFMKQNKLKPNRREDLIQILKEADKLYQ